MEWSDLDGANPFPAERIAIPANVIHPLQPVFEELRERLTYELRIFSEKSVTTGRYKGRLYVSLRIANPNAEAGEILRDVFTNRRDAGGHNGIAGGSFSVSGASDNLGWEKAEQAFVERLLKRLRINIKGEFYYPFC